MRSVAKTVAGTSSRVGRRPASGHDGYLTAKECRALNVSLQAFDAKRGNSGRSFRNFSFRNPVTTTPPAMSQPAAAVKPAAPSIADIVAYLEQQRLAAELEAGRQALQFTRLFGQEGEGARADEYRAKTMQLLGVMEAVATTVRHLQQQPQ